MITIEQQLEARAFRRKVKAELALNGETIKKLAERVNYPPNTISTALGEPWKFPRVIKAVTNAIGLNCKEEMVK